MSGRSSASAGAGERRPFAFAFAFVVAFAAVRRGRGGTWVAALALLAACPPGRDPPAAAQGASPALVAAHNAQSRSAEECGACHPAIFAEWRGSGHGRAWSSERVQEEYRLAPAPACVACHAPAAASAEVPAGRAFAEGVGCGSCHRWGDDGAVEPSPESARAGGAAADRGAAGGCAGCHQFRFSEARDPLAIAEADAIPYAEGWLQDTVGEWARSDAGRRGISCLDCHMPRTEAHRSHRFPGMYDHALVQGAVEVEVRARREGGRVLVDVLLTPGAIGHAFPTGDLFREAVVEVWTEEAASARGEFRLKRWFDDRARLLADGRIETLRVEVADTRVPPPGAGEPPTIALELRSPAARSVAWSLKLYARAPASGGDRGDGVIPVAEGRAPILHRPAAVSRAVSPDPLALDNPR